MVTALATRLAKRAQARSVGGGHSEGPGRVRCMICGLSWSLVGPVPASPFWRTHTMTAAPGAVFVSYRRKDTGHAAYRIRERLAATLGDESVFMDVDSIAPGENFATRIAHAVAECQVLLALIGKDWTTVA